MILFYVILLIVIVLLVWRINHPGDLRLNRKYLARFLKDQQGRGPVQLQTSKLPLDRPADAPEDRAYYHIEAEFADASKRSVLAQIVYPLEELQKERERRNRPGNEDPNIMQSMASQLQSTFQVGVPEDPYKDLTMEEKITAAKVAEVNQEVEHLRMLSLYCDIFPRLIAHDEQRLITITEPVGQQRFDDLWQELDEASRRSLLVQLAEELALLHIRGEDLAALLPPGPSLSATSMRESIGAALENGLELAATTIQQAQAAADPICAIANLEKGLRLANASPRGFFVHDGRVRSCLWGGLRRDLSALDLVELICDPALGLTAQQEEDLLTVYLDKLQQDLESEAERITLVQLRRLVIYFQLVLIGHLAVFERSPQAARSKNPLGIKHWPTSSLSQVANKVLVHLQTDEELGDLYDILAPTLQALVK